MFNKVIIVGHLTRDIEMKHTQSSLAIASTAIASSKKYKTQSGEQRDEVMFLDITFFARLAEIAQQYLRKGSKVLVEGSLKFDQWVDQNGNKRSKHSLTVSNMTMLDSRADGEALANRSNSYQANTPQANSYQQPQQTQSRYDEPVQQATTPSANMYDALDDAPF